jgi:hypothetical protein
MPIATDFTISATGDIRRQAGASTEVYTVLALHEFLQGLSDDEAPSGNDLIAITSLDPSSLPGGRNPDNAAPLTLLKQNQAGTVFYNLDDESAQYFKFGTVRQENGATQYAGLKTIGGIVAASPIYVVQNGSKLTKFWGNDHIQILVKVKTANAFIDNGNVTAFSRKWAQTYSHFDLGLSTQVEGTAALSTAVDKNILLTEAQAATLSAKVAISFGDTIQDLANGNGAKLYKGTITLSNSCTLQEAYQYLQYLTRENSAATLNGIPGWRYRVLNAAYTENTSAPFGAFAGGTFFLAQGWFITGVLPAESTRYELIAHDGTTQVPPTLIGITIGNLVSGDRVLVARDNGSGALLKDEYTPVAASSGATALQVVESIKTDTPSAGVIRIKGLRYTYSSFNAGTKTFSGLSPALASSIVTADDVFVPYIDRQAAGATESVTFIYASNFNTRVDVRNGSGASPIVPFSTTLSITNAGGSVNASRNSDV